MTEEEYRAHQERVGKAKITKPAKIKAQKLPGKPKRKSEPEELFALQLTDAGITFRREALVVMGRKWRLDFAISNRGLAVEIEGWGRHQRFTGFEADCVKYAAALISGWRVLRVTPRQVTRGIALSWVKKLL